MSCPNPFEASCSSSHQNQNPLPPDASSDAPAPPVSFPPLYHPFCGLNGVGEFEFTSSACPFDEEAGTSSTTFLYYQSPFSPVASHFGTSNIDGDLGCLSPLAEAHELDSLLHDHPSPSDEALTSPPPSASPIPPNPQPHKPSGVVFVTPLSAVPSFPEAHKIASASATPSSSAGATVLASPPPPSSLPSSSNQRKRGRSRRYFPQYSSGGHRVRIVSPALAQASSSKKEAEGPSATKANTVPSALIKSSTTLGLGSKWNEIRPATIIVEEKEDVAERVISFAKNNGAVFVLAATGVISFVELLRTEIEVSIFEGRFDIVSLSGTLLLSKGGLSKTGYLTVSLSGVDGRVFGGRVHGRLTAASTVQITGGSIAPAAKKGDQLLKLTKQISSMNQEWQAQLQQHKKEAQEANQRLETTIKELNETRQQLATTQNLVTQLYKRLNMNV